MTTLTVYFALSPTSISSLSSTSTTIQPFQMISNPIKSRPISLTNIPLPNLSSSSIPTSLPTRSSLKRNKTFFERFHQTSPTSLTFPNDSINSSNESQPRLRRRFTFRRSLRKSIQNKGGDNDNGIRSVFDIPHYPNIFVPIHHQHDQ
jgi:hypothetical protein